MKGGRGLTVRAVQAENFIPTYHVFSCRTQLFEDAFTEHVALYNQLVYVIQGKLTYWVDRQPLHVAAGELGYIAKGSLKLAQPPDNHGLKYYSALFLYTDLEGHSFDLDLPKHWDSTAAGALLKWFSQLKTTWETRNQGFMLQSRALLMLLVYDLLLMTGRSERSIDPMSQVKQYIARHFDQRIDINELAGMLQLNPIYFGRLFKKHFGLTVKAYVNQVRVDQARQLLAKGIFNVSEVADLCGFQDVYYFSKVFKQISGRSPLEYRKQW